MNEKQELKYMTERFFPSKIYSYDILCDLDRIIKLRLELFKTNIDEFEEYRAKNYLHELVKFTDKFNGEYEFRNRLYLISGVQFVALACVELSDAAIKNISTDVWADLVMSDSLKIEDLETNMLTSIYIFQANDIIFCQHLYPSMVALILQTLSSKNIVDYGLKKRWTIKD